MCAHVGMSSSCRGSRMTNRRRPRSSATGDSARPSECHSAIVKHRNHCNCLTLSDEGHRSWEILSAKYASRRQVRPPRGSLHRSKFTRFIRTLGTYAHISRTGHNAASRGTRARSLAAPSASVVAAIPAGTSVSFAGVTSRRIARRSRFVQYGWASRDGRGGLKGSIVPASFRCPPFR